MFRQPIAVITFRRDFAMVTRNNFKSPTTARGNRAKDAVDELRGDEGEPDRRRPFEHTVTAGAVLVISSHSDQRCTFAAGRVFGEAVLIGTARSSRRRFNAVAILRTIANV